jgi:signal recognition particle subunit SEC65
MGKKKGGPRIKQIGPKPSQLMQPPNLADAFIPQEEIRLPPPPDRNYQIIWPLSLRAPQINRSDYQIIYPAYLDASKTIKQGRRVAHGVDHPTVMDLSQALQTQQIPHVIQPYKGYSRESVWDNPGRVLVLKTVFLSNNNNKRELIKRMIEIIKELPDRRARLQEQERMRLEEQRQQEAEAPNNNKVAVVIKKKGKKGKKK